MSSAMIGYALMAAAVAYFAYAWDTGRWLPARGTIERVESTNLNCPLSQHNVHPTLIDASKAGGVIKQRFF